MRSTWRRHLVRGALVSAVLLFVVAAASVWYLRRELGGSLPILDGHRRLAGLQQAVTIARDDLGIPTISAASRVDAAHALGFLHAQERFFQMDVQRRQPAGELAALFGERALAADRTTRVHRFRHVARQALARTTPHYRALLEAYAAGVNAGLGGLDRAPFEYSVLGRRPTAWRSEDSILTILAMFSTLQGRQATFERTFGSLHDVLPATLFAFLTARGSEWDAPVVGSGAARPPIPGADVFDLRNRIREVRGGRLSSSHDRRSTGSGRSAAAAKRRPALGVPWLPQELSDEEAAGLGSNNWVVDGRHTATGVALVANDMHLALSVPNIWYRAVMRVPDVIAASEPLQLAGVTLPGLPSIVVGSNGHVAWGFTNTGGDWSDLILIEPDTRLPDHYVTAGGARRFEEHDEIIEVAGGSPETLRVRWTMWGPVIGVDLHGRSLAQRWVAHDASILASDITAPELARSATDALGRFAGLGMPAQNVVLGDRDGHIGWTIAGPIPRRRGHDGMRPTSWADGTRGWDGYLPAHEYPRVLDPPSGRIWTANAPVVDGDMLATIGEGGYADGIRARMIRDRLMRIERATVSDMLAVQLDDGALFHERWRTLVLEVLSEPVLRADPRRAELKRLVESTWDGRASPGSVAYYLVRSVRQTLVRDVFAAITAPVSQADPDFDYSRALRSEGPMWQLLGERPRHLLDPRFASWDDQIVAAIDAVIADLTADDHQLGENAWGSFNRAQVRHPLAAALPLAGRWLNMPSDALSGDIYTPRAQSPRAGPSERIIVSPGREGEGIAHMPSGQSGHPLSPHYRDQHRAWVEGTPLPFLPGAVRHTLRLVPAGDDGR
ncbi:MAG: penicillin acylase family protein [Vicinamibacterales bacterium]